MNLYILEEDGDLNLYDEEVLDVTDLEEFEQKDDIILWADFDDTFGFKVFGCSEYSEREVLNLILKDFDIDWEIATKEVCSKFYL